MHLVVLQAETMDFFELIELAYNIGILQQNISVLKDNDRIRHSFIHIKEHRE